MKNELTPQKLYKIKVNQNPIRQALLTNKIIIIVILSIITVLSFLIFQKFPLDQKLIKSILISSFVFFGLSIRIDGQNFYEIFYRGIMYLCRKKYERL